MLSKALPKMLAGKSKAMWERGSFKGMDDLFAGTSLGEGRGNIPARLGKYDGRKFQGLGQEDIFKLIALGLLPASLMEDHAPY